MIDVVFNSTNLRTLDGVRISRVSKDNPPTRRLSNFSLARADGRSQVSAFYDEKEIVVEGDITANSRSEFEIRKNTLLSKLSAQDAELVLNIAGEDVKYKATVESVIFSESTGGFGAFDIKFVCSYPFGVSLNLLTALASSSITTSVSTKSLSEILGSYQAAPKITITVTSVTGGDNAAVTVTNPLTEKSLTVARTWSNSDVLVVDAYNKLVQVNGVDVDFTGLYPEWGLGAGGQIKYEDEFTTRSVSLKMEYYKRYL